MPNRKIFKPAPGKSARKARKAPSTLAAGEKQRKKKKTVEGGV